VLNFTGPNGWLKMGMGKVVTNACEFRMKHFFLTTSSFEVRFLKEALGLISYYVFIGVDLHSQ
jgi:hypothetical protein